ncbi:MAG: hypothetical protein HY721_01045, partial [Planctomycetes bacterium]|nr:hypothetical protein [Planctomycetota bacterium]
MEGTLEHLRKLAAEKGFDELENVWMGAAESPRDVGERLDAFLDIAEVILSQERETGRTGALLELLVASLSEATPPRVRLRYQGLLVRCFPANKEHRAAFAELFEGLHPLASAERAFYEASGYPSGANPAAALARLERLLRFREGAYVFHRSGWGIGRVTAVDPFLKQVKVDLEHKRDHRIAIEAVDS